MTVAACAVLLSALVAGFPALALGATSVSGQITQDSTWTWANSPYVINGTVTVATGVKLTIAPAVTVKFNGQSASLAVDGTLIALGVPGDVVTFTSIEDDSVGGDTGLDGPTQGVPGQWSEIRFRGTHTASRLIAVNVRYGGYGFADGNAAIKVHGSGASVLMRSATITQNMRSAVSVTNGGTAIVGDSLIAQNTVGVHVVDGFVSLRENSYVVGNTKDGVEFISTNLFAMSPPVIFNSTIADNSRYGVYLSWHPNVPAYQVPYGNWNNIYQNGTKNLYSTQKWFDVDWKENYWGSNVHFIANASGCLSIGDRSPGHLAFTPYVGDPPVGPIRSAYYLSGTTKCAFDYVRVSSADEFSSVTIDNDGQQTQVWPSL